MKNGKEITDQKEVNNKMFDFYNNLLKSDKKDLSMTLFNFWSRTHCKKWNFHIWSWAYLHIKQHAEK